MWKVIFLICKSWIRLDIHNYFQLFFHIFISTCLQHMLTFLVWSLCTYISHPNSFSSAFYSFPLFQSYFDSFPIWKRSTFLFPNMYVIIIKDISGYCEKHYRLLNIKYKFYIKLTCLYRFFSLRICKIHITFYIHEENCNGKRNSHINLSNDKCPSLEL